LASRADRFETFPYCVLDVTRFDWIAFRVDTLASRAERFDTFPYCVLDVTRFDWIALDSPMTRVAIFELVIFELIADINNEFDTAILIIPETFELVIFDWTAIILSAKVTNPAWATNELRTFIVPSTANLPKVVFAIPTATFAIRYMSDPTFVHCEDVIWVF
jgi:hypothetical protein